MKNILVTGGAGFIGVNFIRYLLEESGYEGRVINLDNLTYAANPLSLAGVEDKYPSQYSFLKRDISDRAQLEEVFRSHDIDAVCHFAAESHVDRSVAEPGQFIHTNIIGTYNLLEVAREYSGQISLFQHISTDEVYGSLGPEGRFTEESPYRPSSPYSASKAASDHLVTAYHETYGLPVKISNCSNNYGPYQFPEKLIPLMILNAARGKPLPIYGDGRNVRNWLYVRDHCRAVWTIMNEGRTGEAYNIGGGCEMENIAVVEMICGYLDDVLGPLEGGRKRSGLITFVKDRPGHDRRYAVDSGKLRRDTDWAPEEDFESGLLKTVRWYLENGAWVEAVESGAYREWIKKHYG